MTNDNFKEEEIYRVSKVKNNIVYLTLINKNKSKTFKVTILKK